MMNFMNKLVKFSKCLIFALVVFFSVTEVFSAPENLAYKDWCVETFDNGEKIYEAYRVINFDIEYRLDRHSGYYEFWQKPKETLRFKTGDCEDLMFLFSDLLPWRQDNFEIVWGFVYSKVSRSKTKHVWGELIGKDKQIYYVEGGQADWNAIEKKEIVEKREQRDPIVKLPQRTYTLLQGLFLEYDEFDEILYKDLFGEKELSSEAFHIFKLLHEMTTRE